MGIKATKTYNLKDTTRKANAQKHRYTPELLELIKEQLGDHLYYFGYTNCGDDNETNFFEFDEHKPENLANFGKFREASAKALQWVSAPDYKSVDYVLHRGDQCFPFFEAEDNQNKFEPGLDYAKKQLGYGRSNADLV